MQDDVIANKLHKAGIVGMFQLRNMTRWSEGWLLRFLYDDVGLTVYEGGEMFHLIEGNISSCMFSYGDDFIICRASTENAY